MCYLCIMKNRDLYQELRSIGLTHEKVSIVLDWLQTLEHYKFVQECADDELNKISPGFQQQAIEILEKIR